MVLDGGNGSKISPIPRVRDFDIEAREDLRRISWFLGNGDRVSHQDGVLEFVGGKISEFGNSIGSLVLWVTVLLFYDGKRGSLRIRNSNLYSNLKLVNLKCNSSEVEYCLLYCLIKSLKALTSSISVMNWFLVKFVWVTLLRYCS